MSRFKLPRFKLFSFKHSSGKFQFKEAILNIIRDLGGFNNNFKAVEEKLNELEDEKLDSSTPIPPVLLPANTGFSHEAARNKKTTTMYLESDGVFNNIAPLVIAQDVTLIGISASSDVAETWVAEVHDSGALIPGATLSLTATDSDYRNDLSIAISAGSELMLYCNGSKINKPRIIITLNKT